MTTRIVNRRTEAPTCIMGWKQVTDDCPECGPDGPCLYEPDRVKPSLGRRFRAKFGFSSGDRA